MICSTIIPTVGRPCLARAVESILTQSLSSEDVEVIVVNDSGAPLPVADWQKNDQVQVVDTWHRERSTARNTGAAMAKGRYLHFLDDDDWLLPGALESLYRLARQHEAAWAYGGTQLVDREGRPLIKICPDLKGNCFVQAIAGEWVPLQASLIHAEAFFAVGGFNSRMTGAEDNDLLRRIALTYPLVGIGEIVATVEWRGAVSTTDYDRHPLQSRWAREQILNAPGGFARMRSSAHSGYWHGRIVRAYLTSAIWNFQRYQLVIGTSRGCHAATALLLAGRHWFSSSFWRAITKPYESDAFRRGEIAAQTERITQNGG